MKITKLVIRNIGKLAGEHVIEINKPLILFYGEIKQGKTTILNCVRWSCGGEFPTDIISHGQKEGETELHFDGGMIGRSFYRAKDGTTKARPVTFVRNGRPVASPVAEIKRLLNPFLLDQDFLRNKTELERKQYFAELFQLDTTDLDTELFNVQREAQSLRSKIAGCGEIDLTEYKPVDVDTLAATRKAIIDDTNKTCNALEKELERINKAHADKLAARSEEATSVILFNSTVKDKRLGHGAITKRVAELRKQLAEQEKLEAGYAQWLLGNPEKAMPAAIKDPDTSDLKSKIYALHSPDTADIDAKISEAGAANVRAEQYQNNLKRADAKRNDENALATLEKRGREIKAEKQGRLKSIGENCGIKGLEFDEDGNFIYDGTTAGMISDSQIMRLSSELSALYPEGFGLDLIDRAESLGKSIFEFVDKAKAEKKSILATIVGEKPAKVPADIGVFVVDNGDIKEGNLL